MIPSSKLNFHSFLHKLFVSLSWGTNVYQVNEITFLRSQENEVYVIITQLFS